MRESAKYKADSIKNLKGAIDNAKEVQSNAKADQEQVDIVLSLLKKEIAKAKLKPTEFNVVYKNGDDIFYESVVNAGDMAVPPAQSPVKENHKFKYWTLYDIKYSFELPVTEDLVLSAYFEFIQANKTELRKTITKAENIVSDKENYETIADLETVLSEAKTVEKDVKALQDTVDSITTKLKAEISKSVKKPVKHDVTFNVDGMVVNTKSVTDGKKVFRPADPTKDNYVFKHWAVDSKTGSVYDFDKPVTADIKLYALFEPVPEP